MAHRRRVTLVVLGLLAAALVTFVADPPAFAAGTVSVTVLGQGSASGSGILCTQDGEASCSKFFADDVHQECDPDLKPPCHNVSEPPEVTVTAGADSSGFVFDGWTGCDMVTGRDCYLYVDSDKSPRVRFRDAQGPTVGAPTPSGYRKGTVSLATTASDNAGVQRVEFYGDGAPLGTDTTAPYQLTWDTTTVTDGPKQITARAFDTSNNIATSGATAITVDNSAPTLSVTGPSGQTFGHGTTQTWSISAEDNVSGVSVQCSVRRIGTAPTFAACASPVSHSVTNLAGGTYTALVQATNGAGLSTTASRTFTIDATPPQTTIPGGPAAVVRVGGTTARATFRLASSESRSTFRCKLDGRAWKACTSLPAYTVGLGAHTLRVIATDRFGNADRTAAVRRWTVRRR